MFSCLSYLKGCGSLVEDVDQGLAVHNHSVRDLGDVGVRADEQTEFCLGDMAPSLRRDPASPPSQLR